MDNISSLNTVRESKQYVCYLCGLRICKRARHLVLSGIYEDEPFVERYHEVCFSYTHGWDMADWEMSYGTEAEFREYDLRLPLLRLPAQLAQGN